MRFLLALDAFGVAVLVVLVALAALALRRRFITRRGGTFDCSLRLRPSGVGKGWVLGVGRYAGDTIEWYRVFSYATRPRKVFGRRELEIVDRRQPEGTEALALLSGAVVVRCRDGEGFVDLAMSNDALTGFLSWLESAPPGRPV
jgi:hypothetical protein